jgi:hypothetical protein
VTGDSGIVTGDSGKYPKSVTFDRNERSRWTGIIGHDDPEYPHYCALQYLPWKTRKKYGEFPTAHCFAHKLHRHITNKKK